MALDPIAVATGLVSLVILGLLIWLCVMVYKWYKNPREAPAWLQNIYYYFYPRAYEKTDYAVLLDQSKFVKVQNSTASNCASNCNTTEKCNAFMYLDNSQTCLYEQDDLVKDTSILAKDPTSNAYTYIAAGSSKPVLGYDIQLTTDYTSPTTLIKTITADPMECLTTCASTANCVGVSMLTRTSNNCNLVRSTSTVTTNSNVKSFKATTPAFEAASF